MTGRHGDHDGDGIANQADVDFVDELGGMHSQWSPEFVYEFPDPGWRPESDFTGEWVDVHVARLPRGGAAPPTGVTAATLRAAMGADLPLARHPTLVTDFNAALLAAGCTTVNRAAMFAAQVGHESLGLRYFEELWGPTAQQKRYEPVTSLSQQLGNTAPGDGARFKGRGPIQLTGRGGYTTFLGWCRGRGLAPPDFLRDPGQVATSRWGFLAASHYWTVRRPRINGLCDAGDLDGVTRQINGGTTGIDDRRRRWQACLRLGAALLPGTPTPPRPKREPEMIERPIYPSPAPVTGRIICPTGAASQTVGKAWFSASFDGGARVEAWFQKAQSGSDAAAPGAGRAIDWTLRNAERPWIEVPSGTEFIQYRVTSIEGPGALAVELASK